ncbi:SLAIN motif-containing protein-like isoform X2 [Apus apus]|uniref:SLAIN motif-containing protein-like isoform X2 n=1 Tax=Apus apus TaxID=8895 RepID=UPI0021F8973D|nr:SLAIN motif-containing protein-like isoform X2 [Apus apus]
MVVPGNAPLIQQDRALEPDLGRDPTGNSAMGPDPDPEPKEVGPELEEVRKLRELVRRLELQNQHPRTKSSRSVLGANVQSEIRAGVDNRGAGLNGMEINNSINVIREKQELQIMADLHQQLSKIRREEGENNCLKRGLDAQMRYGCNSATEELSSNLCKVEAQTEENARCALHLDTGDSTELLGNLGVPGVDSSVKINEQNPSEKCGDLGSLPNNTDLDEVKVLELENCNEEEDSWLYVSPRKSATDQKTNSPLKWCRQVLDNPSPETEAACRTLISRLDQASRWKNLYCSPLASPSAHNLNTEAGSCSNALNSPGHLKSTNKALLTCGSSGYLSMHSALSSQSSVDSELSTSDDSISMGYKLQDLTDVQVMARLQEESLRQDCASASASRRSSSASLHSLRRGTYSDQEFDAYSLEDEDDCDCSLSYRSAHRYSPSPLSSPRCQSPSAGAECGRSPASRVRPPRRAAPSPMQDRLKYAGSEGKQGVSLGDESTLTPPLTRRSQRCWCLAGVASQLHAWLLWSASVSQEADEAAARPRCSPRQQTEDLLLVAEEMRHSMPNLARSSLRALESVRSSRSLESDLQVPSTRIPRTQQRAAGLAPSKLRYSSGAGQCPLTARQPLKGGSCTNSLLTPRQPVKPCTYTSPAGGARKPQASSLHTGSSSSSSCTSRGSNVVTVAKNAPVKARTSVGGISVPKSRPTAPAKRFLQTAQAAEDDSWKEGCY